MRVVTNDALAHNARLWRRKRDGEGVGVNLGFQPSRVNVILERLMRRAPGKRAPTLGLRVVEFQDRL